MAHLFSEALRVRLAVLVMVLAPIVLSGHSHAMDRAAPASLGLSAEKSLAFKNELQRRVDAGEMPGAVLLVARHGKVAALEAVGYQDRNAKTPMKTDSIFRIASLTKPIVSVAAMMLVEEGRLLLHDPVAKYLPEFKDTQVAVQKTGPDGKTEWTLERQHRPMTIQDLFRHTAGLTYGQFDNSHVDQLYVQTGILSREQTLEEQVKKLAALPLKHQPGTTFDYSLAVDVLGRVIEVISGQTLDVFIKTRITAPLGMVDTGFWVEPTNHARIAEPQTNPATGKPYIDRPVTSRPKLLNGGGGMVSTASDYARFAQMVLNGGQLEGRRYLSRKSVELMTANHLPPNVRYTDRTLTVWANLSPTPDYGTGFGLGFAIRTEQGRSSMQGSVGEFWWSGATGTNFVADPKEKLILVLLTQQPTRMWDYLALMRQMGHAMVVD